MGKMTWQLHQYYNMDWCVICCDSLVWCISEYYCMVWRWKCTTLKFNPLAAAAVKIGRIRIITFQLCYDLKSRGRTSMRQWLLPLIITWNFYTPCSNKKTWFGRNFRALSVTKLEMPILNDQENSQKQAILSSFFTQKKCFRNKKSTISIMFNANSLCWFATNLLSPSVGRPTVI